MVVSVSQRSAPFVATVIGDAGLPRCANKPVEARELELKKITLPMIMSRRPMVQIKIEKIFLFVIFATYLFPCNSCIPLLHLLVLTRISQFLKRGLTIAQLQN